MARSVPHLHVHLVPRYADDPRPAATRSACGEAAQALRGEVG